MVPFKNRVSEIQNEISTLAAIISFLKLLFEKRELKCMAWISITVISYWYWTTQRIISFSSEYLSLFSIQHFFFIFYFLIRKTQTLLLPVAWYIHWEFWRWWISLHWCTRWGPPCPRCQTWWAQSGLRLCSGTWEQTGLSCLLCWGSQAEAGYMI